MDQQIVDLTLAVPSCLGEYKIKVIPSEIAKDVDEPANDDYVVLGGTEISLLGDTDLYYGLSWPEQRWEVRTVNDSFSTIDYYQPSGLYWIRFVYGPDYWDYDYGNHLPTAPGATDDVITYVDMDWISSGFPTYHTIYRSDDVDYIRVYSGGVGQFTSITIDLSVADAYLATGDWTDDFYADMDIYNPDQSLYGTNMTANGEGSPQIFVGGTQNQYYYVKVNKASNSPIPTGAYRLEVTGTL